MATVVRRREAGAPSRIGAARGVLGVTLGHLVAGPLYAFNTHVIPRVVPLAMAMFQEDRR